MKTVVLLLLFVISPIFSQSSHIWNDVDRIVAIGDLHGDFHRFKDILLKTELVDSSLQWVGGKSHLVQIGDAIDRAEGSRDILDLIKKLEKEAEQSGGMVHYLIGNHEAMVILGDYRYVTEEEFDSFRTPHDSILRELYVQKKSVSSKERSHILKHHYNKFQFIQQMGPQGAYGKWIRSHNTAIKINDILFVHAGISKNAMNYSLEDINEAVRKELSDSIIGAKIFTQSSDGPLWDRTLVVESEKKLNHYVPKMLQRYGAQRIIIGHTRYRKKIKSRLNGTIIPIDTGISKAYRGRSSALIIEKGIYTALYKKKFYRLNL